ncbi:hypothetical protein CI102_11574 [Trichoderma harzianum]|uniref:Uncharacterized protein n=1 Tax=Trichoderma harzianum CBS 226.95 TaxID=983964 RepID=A0A2T4ABW7_TRIHA|nr:hypothetical protein M431DRAFT_423157 [Trichoderma harzianum CBS 226.95]PKK43767.1 hypothetical protein CI102_11574 [Trichoderma harzianum]PTB54569.1 hypothetical protein M431DRAFT_423157 [Trichoderma harzianum CBS 226.95]
MALARGEERIAAFVLCMKLSREAQDACFIPLLFLFFILISIFLYFFTWGGASLHLLVSTLFPKLPFFFLFCFFQPFPHQLTFDLFSGRWPLIVIAPDCMLLIPHPWYLFILIQKHFLSCTVIWSQFCFIGMLKKEGCDWALLRFPLSSCFSSSSSLPVYSLLGYEYYDDMMTLFLSTILFLFHLLILNK